MQNLEHSIDDNIGVKCQFLHANDYFLALTFERQRPIRLI